jgi:hypothetical protein
MMGKTGIVTFFRTRNFIEMPGNVKGPELSITTQYMGNIALIYFDKTSTPIHGDEASMVVGNRHRQWK